MSSRIVIQKKYSFRKGAVISSEVDAQAAGEHLEELRDKLNAEGKRMTPELVVEDARNESSPIHKAFDWDDTVAAHKHRLAQARQLENSLRVEIIRGEREVKHVIAFVNVQSPKINESGEVVSERHYEPIKIVLNDPILMQQMLENARKDLMSWYNRYEVISELAREFFDEVALFLKEKEEVEVNE